MVASHMLLLIDVPILACSQLDTRLDLRCENIYLFDLPDVLTAV